MAASLWPSPVHKHTDAHVLRGSRRLGSLHTAAAEERQVNTHGGHTHTEPQLPTGAHGFTRSHGGPSLPDTRASTSGFLRHLHTEHLSWPQTQMHSHCPLIGADFLTLASAERHTPLPVPGSSLECGQVQTQTPALLHRLLRGLTQSHTTSVYLLHAHRGPLALEHAAGAYRHNVSINI